VLLEKHSVKFQWIEGHTGIDGNERCDVLCKLAAENTTDSDIDSEYENSVN
jgi:ribonuclease HI